MKKFFVVLLSLGLLVAFGATASAATTVKFSGTYYIVGVYDDNLKLADQATSRAFFYQRIRLQPVFQVAEGLTFTARMDAMEKQFGQTDWRGGFDDKNSSRRMNQAFGNPKIQESFEWERGYVGFMTGLGLVQAGIMASGTWGTDFGNDTQSRPRIRLDGKVGAWQYGIVYEKEFESDTTAQPGLAGKADADNDTLALYGIYNWKGGQAGVLYKYLNRMATRPTANFGGKFHALLPFFKVTIGPVYLEGEVVKNFGKVREFDNGVGDIDIDGFGWYLNGKMKLGPANVGALVMYSQGNDGSDPTKVKTGPQSQDLNPALILGNDELQTWTASGGAGGYDSGKANSYFYGIYADFKPTPKLAVGLGLYGAKVDKFVAAAGQNTEKSLGWEFDATATYKLYDNLSYMVGFGYLKAGDGFKGFAAGSAANKVGNDYLLMNKLTLNF